MKKVWVNLGERSYPVFIRSGLLAKAGKIILKTLRKPCRIVIITDKNVARLYLKKVSVSLRKYGFNVKRVVLPAGELQKSLGAAKRLYNALLRFGLGRDSAVVALGGGVIGDLAGFVAATYMRGIRFIQIPTTLIAQVDSSVGGKVAVNHPKGKNLIGAFYQPELVIIDPAVLTTLPGREFTSGLAEVIKTALVRDKSLFRFLERNHQQINQVDTGRLEFIITRSIAIKARVVEDDEWEKGLRAILNYGHTIGHALETLGGYRRYRHGEAVAIGMQIASIIAREMTLVNSDFVARQKAILEAYGLPTKLGIRLKPSAIIQNIRFDKKVQAGRPRFVLPKRIGKVIVTDKVPSVVIKKALANL